ncbi:MAG: NUDIX hydrolase [Flavobacteriaceae bacterium]
MYKVFFNRKPIFLITKIIKQDNNNPMLHLRYSSSENIIKALKSKKVKSLFLYHSNQEKLWRNLLKKFPIVQAAGGLVINSKSEYLFIFRNNKWDLPKGGIEKKENIKDAALREVNEETGVEDIEIIKPLPMTYHFFKRNGVFKLKKTFWYLMKTEFDGKFKPQLNEGITKVEWKLEEELNEIFKNSYENIKTLF